MIDLALVLVLVAQTPPRYFSFFWLLLGVLPSVPLDPILPVSFSKALYFDPRMNRFNALLVVVLDGDPNDDCMGDFDFDLVGDDDGEDDLTLTETDFSIAC